MHPTALFITHLWQYFYVPGQGPWYQGSVWSNVFVVAVLAPAGWLWSRTKFWPLRPLEKMHRALHAKINTLHDRHDEHAAKLDAITASLDDLHTKHDALHERFNALPDHRGAGCEEEEQADAPLSAPLEHS